MTTPLAEEPKWFLKVKMRIVIDNYTEYEYLYLPVPENLSPEDVEPDGMLKDPRYHAGLNHLRESSRLLGRDGYYFEEKEPVAAWLVRNVRAEFWAER
jgi:hypothetical protein